MVDTNEGTDREKNRPDRASRPDGSNLRVVERLRKYFTDIEVTPLDCGDIKIILDNGKTLAIERKRAGDFLGSIGNGHIFRQVERMHASSQWCCVLIEGQIGFDTNDMAVIPVYDRQDKPVGTETTGWRGVSVRGAVYAIQWSGCPVISIEPTDLPSIVGDLIRFCGKPEEHYQSLGRHRIVTFPPLELSEEIVAAFPGVGGKRARALKEFAKGQNDNGVSPLGEMLAWGSAFDLIDRKVRPEGWGDVTVANFRATLGLQVGEYFQIVEDKKIISQVQSEKSKQSKSTPASKPVAGNHHTGNHRKANKNGK